MPDWRKVALFVVVGAAHVGLLTGFNFEAGGLGTGYKTRPIQVSVSFRKSAPADAVMMPSSPNGDTQKQSALPSSAPEQNPVSSNLNPALGAPNLLPTLTSPVWSTRIRFRDADEVDKTAYLNDGFETALEQRLPLDVESIMLEFWIAEDGSTVQVTCLEGACSDAVVASLTRLSELKFSPAIKNNQAVASRKVIQIDPKPRFGL